jgi:hypothetical protein
MEGGIWRSRYCVARAGRITNDARSDQRVVNVLL